MAGTPTGTAKRSITIAGHRTSVSLETPFWEALGRVAHERGLSVQALVAEVDSGRGQGNLSSGLRVHVLEAVSKAAAVSDASRGGSRPPGPRDPTASG